MTTQSIQTNPASTAARADDPGREGRVGLMLIGGFFGLFLGWAALAPLDAAVVGQGSIMIDGNRQTVQHRDGGSIAAISVKEGQRVKAGDMLIDFSAHELIAEERSMAGLVIELEASRERLTAELDGRSTLREPASWASMSAEDRAAAQVVLKRQTAELAAARAAYSGQVQVIGSRGAQLSVRSQGYQEELATIDRRTALLEEELQAMRALAAEGFAPTARVRSLERAKAELDAQRIEITSQMNQAIEGKAESGAQALSLRQERREAAAAELRAVSERLIDATPKLAALRGRLERAKVRAPTDGVVVGLAFHNKGAVVGPGERILEIVPDRADLVVEARIAPRDGDDLVAGAKAQVHFVALDGRNLSRADGTVRRVSADSFRDERTGQPFFLADIVVPQQELDRLAKARGQDSLPLRPGLPAEVVVPMRKRTALQYLLEPLDQSIWRSFREH